MSPLRFPYATCLAHSQDLRSAIKPQRRGSHEDLGSFKYEMEYLGRPSKVNQDTQSTSMKCIPEGAGFTWPSIYVQSMRHRLFTRLAGRNQGFLSNASMADASAGTGISLQSSPIQLLKPCFADCYKLLLTPVVLRIAK